MEITSLGLRFMSGCIEFLKANIDLPTFRTIERLTYYYDNRFSCLVVTTDKITTPLFIWLKRLSHIDPDVQELIIDKVSSMLAAYAVNSAITNSKLTTWLTFNKKDENDSCAAISANIYPLRDVDRAMLLLWQLALTVALNFPERWLLSGIGYINGDFIVDKSGSQMSLSWVIENLPYNSPTERKLALSSYNSIITTKKHELAVAGFTNRMSFYIPL